MSVPPHARPLYQYAKLVGEKGTAQEKADLANDIRVMRELREAFPGSSWEPMEHVVLIEYLFSTLSMEVARARWAAIHRQRYRTYQGRSEARFLEEEQGYTRGQLALQVCLGLPLGQPRSKEDARVYGNAGRFHDAFTPIWNPLFHNLIVDPKTPDQVTCWLIRPEGGNAYRLEGWIPAKDAKQAEYLRIRQRETGESKAFWVQPAVLRTVADWWGQWSG